MADTRLSRFGGPSGGEGASGKASEGWGQHHVFTWGLWGLERKGGGHFGPPRLFRPIGPGPMAKAGGGPMGCSASTAANFPASGFGLRLKSWLGWKMPSTNLLAVLNPLRTETDVSENRSVCSTFFSADNSETSLARRGEGGYGLPRINHSAVDQLITTRPPLGLAPLQVKVRAAPSGPARGQTRPPAGRPPARPPGLGRRRLLKPPNNARGGG